MNPLERQLSTLLHEAPGDPPVTIDADELLARVPRRRRYLTPALAAAAVVAIAVPIAVVLSRGSGTTQATSTPVGSASAPAPPPVADPKADAIARISAALDVAPLPPDAARSDTDLQSAIAPLTSLMVPNQVHRTSWWTAPGDVGAAVDYLKAHPPTGMSFQGWAGGGSDDGQEVQFTDTPSDPAVYPLEIDYDMSPHNGGIAIRVDAWTVWAPTRPSWSFVPDEATSVDLTVVRDSFNPGRPELGGAPTVQRTLTGDALAQLADVLNALPPRAPEGIHHCPAILVDARDVAVFHTPTGDIRFVRNGGICAFNATITAAAGDGDVYIPGGDFTNAVLSALGLPKNYGLGSS
jgi:hypothetical protein